MYTKTEGSVEDALWLATQTPNIFAIHKNIVILAGIYEL